MTKSNLYTGGGDHGKTSLVTGQRVAKDSVRLEAYGTIDEFSSFLGIVLSHPDCPAQQRQQLLSVQNMLFNIGGYLASQPEDGQQQHVWGLTDKDIEQVEHWTDELDGQTPKIRAFVLPGGAPLCAHAHVARTVCRRAERRIVSLAATQYVDPKLLRYVNRLSDYLFILARYCNHIAGVEEITWHKQ